MAEIAIARAVSKKIVSLLFGLCVSSGFSNVDGFLGGVVGTFFSVDYDCY